LFDPPGGAKNSQKKGKKIKQRVEVERREKETLTMRKKEGFKNKIPNLK
jgi:hypothetical protein